MISELNIMSIGDVIFAVFVSGYTKSVYTKTIDPGTPYMMAAIALHPFYLSATLLTAPTSFGQNQVRIT